MGSEQLATLLAIVAAAGERAWRARSVAAAWGEIIGKVHVGCTGLQPRGCMAWGRSLGMRGAVVTRGCVSPGQVRANPRFGKLL